MSIDFESVVDGCRRSGERTRPRRSALLTVFLVAASAMSLTGCTDHPQVSFANRHYAAALRTACSAKDSTLLAKAKEVIERDYAGGTIGDEEVESYRGIITTAEAGEWQEAERECHRFQKNQLAK